MATTSSDALGNPPNRAWYLSGVDFYARTARFWITERDAYIIVALRHGCSVRAVAAAAGVSARTVQRIAAKDTS